MMADVSEFIIRSGSGEKVHAMSIKPQRPRAILQVVHGMMEHTGRYREFAGWMADQGIAVYMNDHRGHGKNLEYVPGQKIRGEHIHGYFGRAKGWERSVDTLHDLTRLAKENHPGLPLFILGHSMGSVMVQSYFRKYPQEAQGVILSGPTLQPLPLVYAGIFLTDIIRVIYGCRYRSFLLKQLSYGGYSRYFKPKRTEFDWLSSDPAVVDAYVNDPLCGFPCTTAFYSDFFGAIRENASLKKVSCNVPLLIFAGAQDPTGHFGKDPVEMAKRYSEAGLTDVEVKVWPEGRHEMLNELNKLEVWEFLLNWMQNRPVF